MKPSTQNGQRTRELGDSKTASKIRFTATLFRPKESKAVAWTFLNLPKKASGKLPTRSMTSVEGTLNGFPFAATLEPDGQGGHWLKVDRKLRESAGAKAGDVITLEIAPVAKEPEPKVPADLRKALAAAVPKTRAVWSDITPLARRDWIYWIVSAKRPETRARRITTACSMLAAGKRTACCFDRSGMYSSSLSCPDHWFHLYRRQRSDCCIIHIMLSIAAESGLIAHHDGAGGVGGGAVRRG